MNKETYEFRKTNGICVRCGKEMARTNRVMCEACAEKERVRRSEDRAALSKMNLCPKCGQNRLYGDEKMCLDCREKMYKYNKTRRHSTGKNYNELRKQNGLCIKCGRRPPVPGRVKCGICLALERERARNYRLRNGVDVDRSERPNFGRCYFCGGEIESGRICNACKERIIKNLPKKHVNLTWIHDNELVFMKK